MGLFACLPYSKNKASKFHDVAKQYMPGTLPFNIYLQNGKLLKLDLFP